MNESLKPGQNPRAALARHRERGPKRFTFTYADVARVAGLALDTVRSSPCRAGFGDLEQVYLFIQQTRARRSQ